MAFSISAEDFESKKYVISSWRTARICDKNLIVSEHGKWVILDDNELEKLKNYKLRADDRLFRLLEEKGIILTKDNYEKIQEYFHNKMGFLFNGVSLHIVVLTNRCSHKCIYCHASSKDAKKSELDMKESTARKTVDFIFQTPSMGITIEFQGGEPLLNFDVLKFIVNYANEKNKESEKDLRFSVVTNLEEMDDEKLDFLVRNNVSVCTSLDGPEELHNFNRRPENPEVNSYRNVKKWIGKMQKRYSDEGKENKVNALVTVTRQSLGKWKEIVDIYAENGLSTIHLRPLNCLGFSRSNWEKIGYSAEEFIEFWKKGVDYIIELNKKGKKIHERTASVILSKILDNSDPNYLDLRSPCGACIGQLAYNYDGSVYSCDDGRSIPGEIFKIGTVKQKYRDAVGCDKSCAIISSSVNDCTPCDDCVWKPYCGICPVFNFAETNSLLKPPVNEDFRCKIHYAQFEYIFEKLMDRDFQKIISSRFSP